ncbi:hypothetical protein A6P55_01580 [Pandoraea pnomenusa]|nr:hypothetical protein A6P55_01580 [Pandoraea pnomenusa]
MNTASALLSLPAALAPAPPAPDAAEAGADGAAEDDAGCAAVGAEALVGAGAGNAPVLPAVIDSLRWTAA